ncbi:hypothetical protein [Frankia sp. KB5]|uniref:hypothetical protein n=1 Tax=Frankia sp. KB5 TaxID=683318 RepID=UPI000A10E576|nr:hypothetical protein [Frankia sp. KB5]ORT46681.1 hypothetical protein KBI5_23890 [Frankia sp. KB5]
MTPPRTVPPTLRPVVLLARMRDLLPPTELADVLAAFIPPIDPAGAAWIDLCAALDAYDHAADQGLDLDEAGQQVDIAAMIAGSGVDGLPPSATNNGRRITAFTQLRPVVTRRTERSLRGERQGDQSI